MNLPSPLRRVLKREFTEFVEVLRFRFPEWEEFYRPSLLIDYDLGYEHPSQHIVFLLLKDETVLMACTGVVITDQIPVICEVIAKQDKNFWCLFDVFPNTVYISGCLSGQLTEPKEVNSETFSLISV